MMNILTLNEEMLLIAILHLKDNAYGVVIMDEIREISQKKIVFGTLYNSLNKLVKKGYVITTRGKPTPERGGRSKIYYTLTINGKIALNKTKEFHLTLCNMVSDFVLEAEKNAK